MIELRNLISRWVYEYYYLFLISTISILKNKNIISGNNLVICKGGIGDTIICINIMNTCSNFCSKTVILTKADQIDFIQKFCKHKLLGITSDIDETYCKINSIQNIYSIRSNPKELSEIASYNCIRYISVNPVFDRIRLITRLMSAISHTYKKIYYSRQNMQLIQSNILNLTLPVSTKQKIQQSSIVYGNFDSNRNIGLHVAGGECIRKIKKETIKSLIESMPEYTFHLLGSAVDVADYPENYFTQTNCIYKIGHLKLSEMPNELSKYKLVVCPDSMIMHLSDSLYIPVVALMGNALPSTWGPIYATSKIISLDPKCSPCKMTSCKVYGGNSCIQAIEPLTIKSSIIELIATSNSAPDHDCDQSAELT